MNIFELNAPAADRAVLEMQLIQLTDRLAQTAQKPMTAGNLEQVNRMARELVEMTCA